MEDDFEPESEEGDADEYDNEPFERVASSEKSEKPSEEHNSSVPSLPGSAPSMHNEAPAPSHLTHVASDPVDEQHEDVNELTNEEDVNELHEDVKEEEALHEEEIHEDPTEEDVEASNDYEAGGNPLCFKDDLNIELLDTFGRNEVPLYKATSASSIT